MAWRRRTSWWPSTNNPSTKDGIIRPEIWLWLWLQYNGTPFLVSEFFNLGRRIRRRVGPTFANLLRFKKNQNNGPTTWDPGVVVSRLCGSYQATFGWFRSLKVSRANRAFPGWDSLGLQVLRHLRDQRSLTFTKRGRGILAPKKTTFWRGGNGLSCHK